MENNQTPSNISKERIKTDESLVAERARTNAIILEEKNKAEDAVDILVSKDREHADNLVLKVRADADDGRPDASKRLAEERARSDEAIDVERNNMDQALEKERTAKILIAAKLFNIERELTDKNLLVERNKTDREFTQSRTLLTSEIAEHARTKTNLTTREEFLAVVSHDLRNPIGAVMACADLLLQDEEYQKVPDEVRHWIEFMKRNADTALRLIADLLEMERIAAGKLELNLDRHSLNQVVSDATAMFTLTAKNKNIQLISQSSRKDLFAVFDRDRLCQVLANLIGNALKYTSAGGSVTISTRNTEDRVEIEVTDTGAGVPNDKLEHIFDRFAQLSSEDRTGLGLGLYISKMFIEAHQGRITVTSKLGVGTTFKVMLKIDGPSSAAADVIL